MRKKPDNENRMAIVVSASVLMVVMFSILRMAWEINQLQPMAQDATSSGGKGVIMTDTSEVKTRLESTNYDAPQCPVCGQVDDHWQDWWPTAPGHYPRRMAHTECGACGRAYEVEMENRAMFFSNAIRGNADATSINDDHETTVPGPEGAR